MKLEGEKAAQLADKAASQNQPRETWYILPFQMIGKMKLLGGAVRLPGEGSAAQGRFRPAALPCSALRPGQVGRLLRDGRT